MTHVQSVRCWSRQDSRSVPWFVIGIVNVGFEVVAGWVHDAGLVVGSRRGYRDKDAQIMLASELGRVLCLSQSDRSSWLVIEGFEL